MNINDLVTILLSEKPSIMMKENERELFKLIPELRTCKGFDQHSIWHPYDVYEHILHVIDNVPNNITLRLAALFHDIGKPSTFALDREGRGHFPNHWVESQKIFLNFIKKYNFKPEVVTTISKLIYYHDIDISKLSDVEKIILVTNFTKEELSLLFKLKEADLLSQNIKYHYLLDSYSKQKQILLDLKG